MADGKETLLTPTNVWLFGRKVTDLKIETTVDSNPFVKTDQSNNKFLAAQVEDIKDSTSQPDEKRPNFARIYGFAYAGAYYELETPALYLVHGPGASASGFDEVSFGTGNDKKKNERAARSPKGVGTTGLAATDFHFADDVMAWAYDKGDFSIRLDVSSGTLDDILLDLEGCDSAPAVAGSKVMGSKVSGSKVSGSKVAGSKIRGSKLGD